ncbi:hypothetical protein [Paenibacillus sp. GP183]|uniref:hypothetical protein n=1 Tax=Paenibacillus sp. GP183 TaxID=1882751 RepID=UPI00268757E3
MTWQAIRWIFFDYLFGPVTEVKGWASNQENRYAAAEDFVAGTYKFASGVYDDGGTRGNVTGTGASSCSVI